MSDTVSTKTPKKNTTDTPNKKRKLEKDNLEAELQARANVIEFLVDNLKSERELVDDICYNLEVLLHEIDIKHLKDPVSHNISMVDFVISTKKIIDLLEYNLKFFKKKAKWKRFKLADGSTDNWTLLSELLNEEKKDMNDMHFTNYLI